MTHSYAYIMFTKSQVLLLTTSSLMTPMMPLVHKLSTKGAETLDSRYIGRSVPFLIMLKKIFAKLVRLATTTTRMLLLHEVADWKNLG
jgi:hypothetical protein